MSLPKLSAGYMSEKVVGSNFRVSLLEFQFRFGKTKTLLNMQKRRLLQFKAWNLILNWFFTINLKPSILK